MNWHQWHYSPSQRQHIRYYTPGDPFGSHPKTSGVIAKLGQNPEEPYNWAVYLAGGPNLYGTARTLAAAKRDADRAEILYRLDQADEQLTIAKAALAEARQTRDQIAAELRPARRRTGAAA